MFINCKGHLIDLGSPKVMGIINLTPDSFYDGGKYKSEKGIIEQVKKMLFVLHNCPMSGTLYYHAHDW